MNKIGSRKRTAVILSVIIGVIITAMIFSNLLFYNSSYTVPKTRLSRAFISDVIKSQSTGTLEITNEELSAVTGLYLGEEKTYGHLTIKSLQGKVINDKLNFYIPSTYMGVNFLFSSEGTLVYKDNKAQYTPESFHIGKMPLPKNLVLNKLKSLLNKDIYVKDSSIYLDLSGIPIKIKNLYLKNNGLVIEVEKLSERYNDKLRFLEEILKYL